MTREEINELELDIQYHQSEKNRLSEYINSDKDMDEYNDHASELEYLQLKLETEKYIRRNKKKRKTK